jgi:hypothetical protein
MRRLGGVRAPKRLVFEMMTGATRPADPASVVLMNGRREAVVGSSRFVIATPWTGCRATARLPRTAEDY